jgi:uncharacterized Rossmann fold enzyme
MLCIACKRSAYVTQHKQQSVKHYKKQTKHLHNVRVMLCIAYATQNSKVCNMHKLTFKSIDIGIDNAYTAIEFGCDFTVVTAGDGLWDCEAGRVIHVTGIVVVTTAHGDNAYVTVNVVHDSDWNVYTDSAFEAAITAVLGTSVRFTEQGMQDDNYASMEF